MAETAHLIAKSWTSHANTTLGYVGSDGHFVAIGDIEGHGHAPEDSEVYARRLAAAWNACEGITTDELEHIASTGGMLGPREDVARIASQRDEVLHTLLLALPYVEDAQADPCYKPGAVAKMVQQMRAAIAKATGQEARPA